MLTITLTPTPEVRDVGGVSCRVWAGMTSAGRRVLAVVALVECPDPAARAEVDDAVAFVVALAHASEAVP